MFSFNGWLFENYEDAKTAILGTILDEISKEKSLSGKAKDIIAGLYKSVDKFKLVKNALKYGTDLLRDPCTANGRSLYADAVRPTVWTDIRRACRQGLCGAAGGARLR